jgi:hypothetical protein
MGCRREVRFVASLVPGDQEISNLYEKVHWRLWYEKQIIAATYSLEMNMQPSEVEKLRVQLKYLQDRCWSPDRPFLGRFPVE